MLYFNCNGKILQEHALIAGADNRGLRYGDGLFETLKFQEGRLILLDEHLARLWKGMRLMKFQIPKHFTPDVVEEKTLQLIKKNNQQTARVRISVTRGEGGLYDTKDHSPNYIIQSWSLADNNLSLNENGLQLCIYRDAKKIIDGFSNLKHNNYLPYFMAALSAREQRCNDAIVLNNYNRICDSSIANIFLIKDETIYTPSLDEGCIAGVMRNFIIQQLKEAGYPLVEKAITEEELWKADEIFLTNSIFNIRWVAAIEDTTYVNLITKKIFEELCQTNPTVFC